MKYRAILSDPGDLNQEVRTRKLEARCASWNARYPPGTPVWYSPVIGEPPTQLFATRGPAYVLSGHTAVIFLEGKAGCVALDALTVDPFYAPEAA
jgi:hypothetical protein